MYEGEILGWRIIHDNPPEVLVRVKRPVIIQMDYFNRVSSDPVEVFAGYEWDTEWRYATEGELERDRLAHTKSTD